MPFRGCPTSRYDDILCMVFDVVSADAFHEALGIMMDIVHPEYPLDPGDRPPRFREIMQWSPDDLARVCKHWKVLVDSTPILWSYILAALIPDVQSEVIAYNTVKRIHRSTTCGLHVWVFVQDTLNQPCIADPNFARIQCALWTHSPRWLSIHIWQSDHWAIDHTPSQLWTPVVHNPARLTHARLLSTTIERWSSFDFTDWSSLTSVHIDLYAGSSPTMPLRQLPSLHHVVFRFMHPNDDDLGLASEDFLHAFTSLDGCNVIQTLRVIIPELLLSSGYWEEQEEPPSIPDTRISLPSLHSFTQEGINVQGLTLCHIYPCLHLPGLRECEIQEPNRETLGSIIVHSWKCVHLHTLSFTTHPDEPSFSLAPDMLEAIGDVHTLSLYAYGSHRSLSLVDQLCDPAVAPKLQHLTLGLRHLSHDVMVEHASTIGFDSGFTVARLIASRQHCIMSVTAAVTCADSLVPALADYIGEIEARRRMDAPLSYTIWTFGEDLEGYRLHSDHAVRAWRISYTDDTFLILRFPGEGDDEPVLL